MLSCLRAWLGLACRIRAGAPSVARTELGRLRPCDELFHQLNGHLVTVMRVRGENTRDFQSFKGST